jgi:glycosyltransferase involved in cell wall biosynthesis
VKKTLLLLDSLTAIGGSERKAVRIANELNKRGHGIIVGYLNAPDVLLSEISKDIIVEKFGRSGKFDFNVLKRIKEIVNLNKVDTLICMNLYPSLYGAIAKILFWKNKLKFIVLINTNNFVPRIQEWKMLIYRPLIGRASKVIFGCDIQRIRWIRRYGLNPSQCSYIYNGVDLSYFSCHKFSNQREKWRKEFNFSEKDIVIANVAALLPKKKQEDLIEACANLLAQGYQVQLVFVGEGPRREFLTGRANQLGVAGKVNFLGQLLDVRPVLCASDIFSLSSTAENFSNAALEAMAMGMPVVLSDVGGAAEMVTEGVNGFLYPASDTVSLARSLRVLVEDSGVRQSVGLRAREAVETNFSFEKMIGEYERLLTRPEAYGVS